MNVMSPDYVPAGLRRDPPPQDGRQFVAWALDLRQRMHQGPDDEPFPPRWMIVQFAADWRTGPRYWRCQTPGYSTSVQVLGWMPLPENDNLGGEALAEGFGE